MSDVHAAGRPKTPSSCPRQSRGETCGDGPRAGKIAIAALMNHGEAEHPALLCTRCGLCRVLSSGDPAFAARLEQHMQQLADWRTRVGPATPRPRSAVPFWDQVAMFERIWDRNETAAAKAQRRPKAEAAE